MLASCSSDSPTRPGGPTGGGGTGGGGGTSTTFAITVNVSPGELLVDDADGSLVTVTVRRNDTGQAPPNGSTVTLTTTRGSFLAPNGGSQSEVLQLLNGSASIRFFGGSTEGTAVIQARVDQSLGQAQVLVRTDAAFALGSVSPTSGDPIGGQTLTITGQGIEAPVQVEFQTAGSQAIGAQVVSVTPNQIQVVVPPSAQTVGVGQTLLANIAVTIAVGSANQTTQTLNGVFAYALGGSLLRPVVSTVTPQNGPNEGGTRIRILGDGFESHVQVIFGSGNNPDTFQGTEAVVESVTRTEIVAVTPSAIGVGQDNRNSFVDLLVRNQRTGAAIIDQTAFQYGQSNIFISSIGPGEGSHLGGTRVTLFGSGFDEPVAVGFAGVAADIISVTGTEIIARTAPIVVTSCGDITGPSTVVNIETSDGASGPAFRYITPVPLIEDVSGRTQDAAGGGTVTVRGRNFESPVRVLFGDTAGDVLTVNEMGTVITVSAPAFEGNFPTETCTTGGSIQGTRQTPVRVDLRVINLLTTCSTVLTNAITYEPDDGSCVEDAPVANFSFTVNGTVVSFLNSSTNATDFVWDFGAPSVANSNEVNPSRDFASAVPAGETRTFSVTLTATNDGPVPSTATRAVTVTAPAPPPPPP